MDGDALRAAGVVTFGSTSRQAHSLRRRRLPWWVVAVALLGGIGLCLGMAVWRLRYQTYDPFTSALPAAAEFETQDRLLVAWHKNLLPENAGPIVDMVAAAHHRVPVTMVVANGRARSLAERALREAGVAANSVTLVTIPVEYPWIRDYGPHFVRSREGLPFVVDLDYVEAWAPDDLVPRTLARSFHVPCAHAALMIEGGNLLTNGAGLCLTAREIQQVNAEQYGHNTRYTTAAIKRYLGARDVVYLEALDGEPTGHIDVFVTFTAVDHVVVGRYRSRVDPRNAEILDRNAERLRALSTPRGPLRVTRVDMPEATDGIYRSYTNVVYVNGLLLVPVYPTRCGPLDRAAVDVFRGSCPGWQIQTIDCEKLIQFHGALRCASKNIPAQRATADSRGT